jgi:hypothetical protein
MLLVRARREGDIEQVFPGAQVEQTVGRDYMYRTVQPRDRVANQLAEEVRGIDYPNFKKSVKDPELHSAYQGIWRTMADLQPISPFARIGLKNRQK